MEWSCLCAAVGDGCDVVCCEWTICGSEVVCWSPVAGAPFAVCVAVIVDECFAALAFCPCEAGVGWCGCFVVCRLLSSVLGASCVCLDVWASEVCACFECVSWHVSPAFRFSVPPRGSSCAFGSVFADEFSECLCASFACAGVGVVVASSNGVLASAASMFHCDCVVIAHGLLPSPSRHCGESLYVHTG